MLDVERGLYTEIESLFEYTVSSSSGAKWGPYLCTGLTTVKDDDTAKDLGFGPVTHNIGNAIGVSVKVNIPAVEEDSRGKVFARFYTRARNISPCFINAMLMDAVIKVEKINGDLVR